MSYTHRTVFRTIAALAAVAAAMLTAADTKRAEAAHGSTAAANCEAAAIESAGRVGIGPGDIERIEVSAVTVGGESKAVFEYLAWISPKSCAGTLVVTLTRSCRAKDSYTRGACAFPGVPAY